MSLLSAIPGLAKHQIEVPKTFDREKAFRLVGDAVSLLTSFYPAGAQEWLETQRPDVIRFLEEAEVAVDAAILADNQETFPGALERFVKLHRRAFAIYAERPPIIERQEELFSAAVDC